MTRKFLTASAAAALLAAVPAAAQDHDHDAMSGMAPMPSPTPAPAPDDQPMDRATDMAMDMAMPADTPAAGSGTARLPAAEGAMHGYHAMAGRWMLMAHGTLLAAWTDQGGPRGESMAYTGSMAMLAAERDLGGGGRFALHAMFSLDPVNGARGYPNLFATGEEANGVPLVDRQHPHDLFMELSARADVPLGGGWSGFVYGGPVAEPALGPSAFVHRRSGRYLPLSPIGHHWFDSTHVTFGVITAGVANRAFQLEGSAFRGREPDSHRWDIETPKLDSWSLRATWSPGPNWTMQASYGEIASPEAAHPGEDEHRATASVHYAQGGLSAMLGFAIKDRVPGETLTAWLAEATWDVSRHHSLFGRIENLSNDELFPDPLDPNHDRRFRVTRFEAGYAWRVALSEQAELALGGSLAAYAKPAALDAAYGKAPVSATLFARLALGD